MFMIIILINKYAIWLKNYNNKEIKWKIFIMITKHYTCLKDWKLKNNLLIKHMNKYQICQL